MVDQRERDLARRAALGDQEAARALKASRERSGDRP